MIHQYKLDGYNIVLDICSGSVHAVDELAYDIIAMFETESRDMIIRELTEKYRSTEGVTPEEVGECYDQIAQLKDKNLGEYLLLPINMFRSGETVFLDDLTAEDVEKALQVKIRIVKSDGQDFVHAILDPSSEPEPEPKEEGLPGEEYGYEGYELDEIWEDEDEYIEDDETESER